MSPLSFYLVLVASVSLFILATIITKFSISTDRLLHSTATISNTLTLLLPFRDLFLKKLFISCLVVLIPGYLFINPSLYNKLVSIMGSYLRGGPKSYDGQSTGFGRGFLNRRKFRSNSDISEEVLQKVLKKGGNIGGLINDGNTCFMNSVLQSLSSSNTLIEFLNDEKVEQEIQSKELIFTKNFRSLIDSLNGKHYSKNHDYKTDPLLKTMTKTPNKNFLMGYNQEDAQEFFQSILSQLESDYKKIHSLPNSTKLESFYNKDLPQDSIFGSNELGKLGDVYIPANQIDPNLEDSNEKSFKFNLLTPLDGLSAERIGCLQCGEMGGIRYSVTSGLSLNLPPDNYTALKLTDLLKDWIKPEIIEGVDCNRCALKHVLEYQNNQLQRLIQQQQESPTESASSSSSSSKLIELLRLRIQEISKELEKPIIDDEIFKKLHTKNMIQKSSKSKQILISRPPPLLSIHINRSVFDPTTYRVRKNNARVIFPLKLDLDPFVAEPNDINTDARLPLSKKVFLEDEEDVNGEVEKDLIDEDDENSSEEEDDDDDDDENEAITPDSNGSIKSSPEDQEEASDVNDVSDLSNDESDSPQPTPRQPEISHEIPRSIEKQDISGPLVYQLRSVIVHYGTHNYGHYIAFRKYRGVWWRTSDETIDIVDEDEVLSTPGVFMLFYELDSLSESLKKDDQKVEININGGDVDDDKNGNFNQSLGDDTEALDKDVDGTDESASNDQAMIIANL